MRFKQGSTLPVAACCAALMIGSAYGVGLPDTGQDGCRQGGWGEFKECTAANTGDAAPYPGQDGRFGRDAAAAVGKLTKTGGGSAGFDYTKICNSGKLAGQDDCPTDPNLGKGLADWGCTRDNTTELIWEVKTSDDPASLRDMDWLYSWYSTDITSNGGDAGQPDGADTCFDTTRCDTEKFVEDVNSASLCGNNDWRLPSSRELLTLLLLDSRTPAIDLSHFPNTTAGHFWSANSRAAHSPSGWHVSFGDGQIFTSPKTNNRRVRLVRGGQF